MGKDEEGESMEKRHQLAGLVMVSFASVRVGGNWLVISVVSLRISDLLAALTSLKLGRGLFPGAVRVDRSAGASVVEDRRDGLLQAQ